MFSFLLATFILDLTFREVLAGLPHDAGAVVFVILVGGFILLTWYGSKPLTIRRFQADREGGQSPEEVAEPGPSTESVARSAALEPRFPPRPLRKRSRESEKRA